MTDTQTINTLADLLHTAGDLIAEHPGIPAPYITGIEYSDGRASVQLQWFLPIDEKDHGAQKRRARRIIKTIGGKWDKDPDPGERFNFEQKRDGLKLTVQVEREAVCERIVIGTETVTIPARPAVPEATIEREVVEWRCEPLLTEAVSR